MEKLLGWPLFWGALVLMAVNFAWFLMASALALTVVRTRDAMVNVGYKRVRPVGDALLGLAGMALAAALIVIG